MQPEPHAYETSLLQADATTGVFPSREGFHQLADRGRLIPVYKEIIADVATPVSALNKLQPQRFAYLLESVEGGERQGRYSFVGANATALFRSYGKQVIIDRADGTKRQMQSDDPLIELEQLLHEYELVSVPGLPRFFGGVVGYLGYDMVRHWQALDAGPPKDINVPDSCFLLSDNVLIFDHVRNRIQIVANARVDGNADEAYNKAVSDIQRMSDALHNNDTTLNRLDQAFNGTQPVSNYTSNMTKQQFKDMVTQARQATKFDDVSQVVVSQRLAMPMQAEPFDMYRVLRSVNPSPYMIYLKFDELAIVGSSPEVMVRVEENEALLRPIAGTKPRGATPAEDELLMKELLADDKERAEHIMLVELGRHDLEQVCIPESIVVEDYMDVERYSHVMHIVSTLKGRLKQSDSAFDVLRATFPAGTLTGAPKVRAMQIIDELEPTNRGPYGGAIGYFGYSGNMDCCITIRTAIITEGTAYVQAGAGIVADSDPDSEYVESLNKARGLLTALAVTEGGFVP